jgi:ribosome modulation factor
MIRASDFLRPALGEVPRPGEIAAELMPYYEEGVSAGAAGHSIDGCRYRRQDRIAAWTRGWHDGQAQRQAPKLTAEERAKGRAGIAMLRASLGEISANEGWVLRLNIWHWVGENGRTRCGRWIYSLSRCREPREAPGMSICNDCRLEA